MNGLPSGACRFCDRDALAECGRCGAPYCGEHGRDGLCSDCRSPFSGMPSRAVFRGSLLTIGVAAVLGVWALVASPTLPGEHRRAQAQAQNPAAVQPVPGGGTDNSAVPTPNPFAATATPATARSYTVALGDTLNGIATSFNTTVDAIQGANPGVTAANLKAGQQLLIPPPPTPTPSVTPTPSPTVSPSPTTSPTPAPTSTPTPEPSPTPAATPSATASPAASASPTASPAP